jgi:DNA-binding Lrp family transcriptional regulator
MSLSKDIKASESTLEKRLNKLEVDGHNPFRVLVERKAFQSVASLSLSSVEGGRVHVAVLADSSENGESQWFKEDYEARELQGILASLIQHLQAIDMARFEEYAEWADRIMNWFAEPGTSLALRVKVRSSTFSSAAAKLRQ